MIVGIHRPSVKPELHELDKLDEPDEASFATRRRDLMTHAAT